MTMLAKIDTDNKRPVRRMGKKTCIVEQFSHIKMNILLRLKQTVLLSEYLKQEFLLRKTFRSLTDCYKLLNGKS